MHKKKHRPRKKFRNLRRLSFLRKFFLVAVAGLILLIYSLFDLVSDPFADYYGEYYDEVKANEDNINEQEYLCDDLCRLYIALYADNHYPLEGYLLEQLLGAPEEQLNFSFAVSYGLVADSSNIEFNLITPPEEWQIKPVGGKLNSLFNVGASDVINDYILPDLCAERTTHDQSLNSFRWHMQFVACMAG